MEDTETGLVARMKFIHFTILDKTLCGAENELVPEHLVETRRFCNECIQVMWKEQYRRQILNPILKKRPKFTPRKSTLALYPDKISYPNREISKTQPKRFKPLIQYMKVTE